MMKLVLNNVASVNSLFQNLNRKAQIMVIAYSAGLHKLRDDTSSVKIRVNIFVDS